MQKRLLEHDAQTGRKQWMEEKDDTIWIREEQDIQEVLDYNQISYNSTSHKGFKNELRKKNMWHVMSVPCIVVAKMLHDKGINLLSADESEFERACKELKSAEYSKFRLTPGKW